jgi:8-oxo-dGTP pyrophosphatase MutT (NUDIX family)
MRFSRASFAVVVALLLIVFWLGFMFSTLVFSRDQSHEAAPLVSLPQLPLAPLSVFKGVAWESPLTVSRAVVHETPFARCEIHSVYSEDHSTIQEDWLWVDELDHVNVITFDAEAQQFVFFKQRKYGIEGESFAPVGGFLEAGENGFQACRRESKEELGVASRSEVLAIKEGRHDKYNPEADEGWVVLGRYRIMSNRGGGFQTICFNRDAVQLPSEVAKSYGYKGLGWGGGSDGSDPDAGNSDGEAQAIVRMTIAEARMHLMKAEFKEIKWTASLALSLLYLQDVS